MTTTDARGWINALIKAMHEETSGSWPDPEYKDEVYSALEMAIQALSQEPCDDAISREAVIEATYHCGDLQEVRGVVQQLPSVTQKSGKYTADELGEFADGISLSLCSKKSAQHWSYDEETAEEIRWLECLHSKVMTDIADTNCGAKMVEPQESEDKE